MTMHAAVRLAALMMSLAPIPTSLAADDPVTIRGEVAAIQRGSAAESGGELDRLTVRTRKGETRYLLLGEPGSCGDCVAAGDRIRARVMPGEAGGELQRVRSMHVRRTGETLVFRNEAGELVRTRNRLQNRTASDPAGVRDGRQRPRRLDSAGRGGRGGRGR